MGHFTCDFIMPNQTQMKAKKHQKKLFTQNRSYFGDDSIVFPDMNSISKLPDRDWKKKKNKKNKLGVKFNVADSSARNKDLFNTSALPKNISRPNGNDDMVESVDTFNQKSHKKPKETTCTTFKKDYTQTEVGTDEEKEMDQYSPKTKTQRKKKKKKLKRIRSDESETAIDEPSRKEKKKSKRDSLSCPKIEREASPLIDVVNVDSEDIRSMLSQEQGHHEELPTEDIMEANMEMIFGTCHRERRVASSSQDSSSLSTDITEAADLVPTIRHRMESILQKKAPTLNGFLLSASNVASTESSIDSRKVKKKRKVTFAASPAGASPSQKWLMHQISPSRQVRETSSFTDQGNDVASRSGCNYEMLTKKRGKTLEEYQNVEEEDDSHSRRNIEPKKKKKYRHGPAVEEMDCDTLESQGQYSHEVEKESTTGKSKQTKKRKRLKYIEETEEDSLNSQESISCKVKTSNSRKSKREKKRKRDRPLKETESDDLQVKTGCTDGLSGTSASVLKTSPFKEEIKEEQTSPKKLKSKCSKDQMTECLQGEESDESVIKTDVTLKTEEMDLRTLLITEEAPENMFQSNTEEEEYKSPWYRLSRDSNGIFSRPSEDGHDSTAVTASQGKHDGSTQNVCCGSTISDNLHPRADSDIQLKSSPKSSPTPVAGSPETWSEEEPLVSGRGNMEGLTQKLPSLKDFDQNFTSSQSTPMDAMSEESKQQTSTVKVPELEISVKRPKSCRLPPASDLNDSFGEESDISEDDSIASRGNLRGLTQKLPTKDQRNPTNCHRRLSESTEIDRVQRASLQDVEENSSELASSDSSIIQPSQSVEVISDRVPNPISGTSNMKNEGKLDKSNEKSGKSLKELIKQKMSSTVSSEEEEDDPDFKRPKTSTTKTANGERSKEDKLLKCSRCKKRFEVVSSMMRHECRGVTKKVHPQSPKKKTAAFKCNDCGRSYGQKCHLSHHYRTYHLKYKPYVCDICEMSFGEKQTLVVHQRIHSGDRPYECNFCTQQFFTTSKLHDHYKKHHFLAQKYHCSFCDHSYFFSNDLHAHVQNVHFRKQISVTKNLDGRALKSSVK